MKVASQTARRVVVLGSTGSIGRNALEVIEHLSSVCGLDLEVVGLAAGRDAKTVIDQARRFNVEHLALADHEAAKAVGAALPEAKVLSGDEANAQLVDRVEASDVIAAVVGSAGLPAALKTLEGGMRLCLANKETLVAAGQLVTTLIDPPRATLVPVDSEHSAIFQCLQGGSDSTGSGRPEAARIVLTASGGPFRDADKPTIDAATPEQALNHPTWKMGPKITIDSATMMNKALEIIEAHWLFGLGPEQIEVIVHPESIVHSFVEFADHSVLAQLGPPDMRTPIQYALTYPDRSAGRSRAMDWTALSELTFQSPDHERFPALKLAYDVIRAGGTAGAVFNAANEAAVEAFLAGQIRFGRIVELVEEALNQADIRSVDSLETALEADAEARQAVGQRMEQGAPGSAIGGF